MKINETRGIADFTMIRTGGNESQKLAIKTIFNSIEASYTSTDEYMSALGKNLGNNNEKAIGIIKKYNTRLAQHFKNIYNISEELKIYIKYFLPESDELIQSLLKLRKLNKSQNRKYNNLFFNAARCLDKLNTQFTKQLSGIGSSIPYGPNNRFIPSAVILNDLGFTDKPRFDSGEPTNLVIQNFSSVSLMYLYIPARYS